MKYIDLRKKITLPIFSRQDLKLRRIKVFDYQFSLWQKKEYLVKLRNGLYAFADRLLEIEGEEISNQLYAPSYVSLEKALSIYGFIPEMVYAITAITPKITRRFSNKLGHFIFRHIKPSLFFGYRQTKGKSFPYLIAEPEKALLDYIYFNPHKLRTEEGLKESRLNWQVLSKTLSRSKLRRYLSCYKNKILNDICQKIVKKL